MFGVLIAIAIASTDAPSISVRIDTKFAREVLEEVCSGQTIDEHAIRASGPAQIMVDHFHQFRADFTMDAYVAARKSAAQCITPAPDIFRFGEVIERRTDLELELDAIESQESEIASQIEAMLSAYTPDGVTHDGAAMLMLATPSCGGWSKGADFFVDVPCLNGDSAGMTYLIAHETYHAVQASFMPSVAADAAPAAEIFADIIREGSASVVADFSALESDGAYTRLSQRILTTNERRMAANYDLFNMAFFYLDRARNADRADQIRTIGLSGLFDGPFYAVGSAMFRAIDAAFGREPLLCLMTTSPEQFFLAYEKAAEATDSPALGEDVLKSARRLSTKQSRAKAAECLSAGQAE